MCSTYVSSHCFGFVSGRWKCWFWRGRSSRNAQRKSLDVEDQLRFIIHVIEGENIRFILPLLNGSFTSWICNNLGIPVGLALPILILHTPDSILPSVRCGLEMALLNAIAAAEGSSLLDILCPHTDSEEQTSSGPLSIRIYALIDAIETPSEVAHAAATLVKEGFTAIKLKVARRTDPAEDADVIKEVRKIVGGHIEVHAAANRKWTYGDAIRSGNSVKDSGLQYIEEPVNDEDGILKFCEATGYL